jgi:hypothetical protein
MTTVIFDTNRNDNTLMRGLAYLKQLGLSFQIRSFEGEKEPIIDENALLDTDWEKITLHQLTNDADWNSDYDAHWTELYEQTN